MLETMAHLTHDRCMHAVEVPDFEGHATVTEVELCADYFAAWEEQEADHEAEIHAEGAWLRHAEGGWDPMGIYLAESLLTAGGQVAREPFTPDEFAAEDALDAYLATCPDA
jgi:hypothetical protein